MDKPHFLVTTTPGHDSSDCTTYIPEHSTLDSAERHLDRRVEERPQHLHPLGRRRNGALLVPAVQKSGLFETGSF
jgi:hypothetical protein